MDTGLGRVSGIPVWLWATEDSVWQFGSQKKQNTDSVFAMLSKADMFDMHMTKVKDESARSLLG